MSKHHDSDIDGFRRYSEQLIIRDRNIVDMFGEDFAGSVYYLMFGEELDESGVRGFNQYLCTLQTSCLDSDALFLETSDKLGLEGMARLTQACLFYPNHNPSFMSFRDLDQDDGRMLYTFSKLPLIMSKRKVPSLIDAGSFASKSLDILRGKESTELEKKIFEMTMISFIGGFGYFAPTTLLPRAASSTGSDYDLSVAAGMCASGQYHIGAIEGAMQMFSEMAGKTEDEMVEDINERRKNGVVPGMGHPMFHKDPRPEHIRRRLEELGLENEYTKAFDFCTSYLKEKKNINPNIDCINAVSVLSLGLEPEQGTQLFAFGRMPSMYAHAKEEKSRKPYNALKRTIGMWTVLPRRLFDLNFDKLNKWFNKGVRNRIC